MRPILAASLLLSPMLLTASAVASQPKADASDTAQVRAVSTGVTAPEILSSASLHIPASAFANTASDREQVVLTMNVDPQGNPQRIQVVKSSNHLFDMPVVDAVRQTHFRPAKLNNQAIPMVVNLVVEVQRAQ